ncbi:hypothetical protein B0T18DRAFT_447238 [Schizothecium vesticola]|uniref:Uncharacterized protein n=1 Tax=Schizothecium vesticola TaxID=314040 RepID=A0AA40K5K6_9PEZI|nr:hypothetical protein B0T18DRAFT_447238 [Schizothecium vesticola]
MTVRSRTIALLPFFENDPIGLARDLDNGERLNAVMLLLPSFGTSSNQLDRDALFKAVAQGLTAMVTGATGVSGYNMVKVLAESANWDKIYFLSSCPPPANFFSDLGSGADKVTHLVVDFISNPSIIAQSLRVIKSVDHIFYFSYKQPPPKGNVLNLWSNATSLATSLATINTTLLTNLLHAFPLTPLSPRHILFQTGTKHYAFYLGPCLLPAFKFDPRIPLSTPTNFYYA